MSRKTDPRTEGKPLDQKKGGKRTVNKEVERDKQAAIEALHDAETEVLEPVEEFEPEPETEPEPAPKPKFKAKRATAARSSKPAKAKKPAVSRPSDLTVDLPDAAILRTMYQGRYRRNGEWRWSYPCDRISQAEQVASYDLHNVRIVRVWYDPPTDTVVRWPTPEELEAWDPDVRRI